MDEIIEEEEPDESPSARMTPVDNLEYRDAVIGQSGTAGDSQGIEPRVV